MQHVLCVFIAVFIAIAINAFVVIYIMKQRDDIIINHIRTMIDQTIKYAEDMDKATFNGVLEILKKRGVIDK